LMKLMREIRLEEEQKELEWDANRRWWIGKVNTYSGVTASFDLPSSVTIMDSTLREGEEVPGTVLTIDQKVALAHRIAETGFSEMEVGYAGVIDEHQQVVRALRQEELPVKLASHTRIYGQEDEWKREIDKNLEVGVDILTFVGFASEVGTATTPWLRKEDVASRVAQCVRYAKTQGADVCFGLADLVRTQMRYIVDCYTAATEAGADRLYVYDGLGAATPEAMGYLTHFIRDIGGSEPQIAVHVHNTFGMATASALRAVTAGASCVDAVPLGLGDGAGITASEELALALEVLYGTPTGISLTQLKELCEDVAAAFGIDIPPSKALVGTNQYRHSIDSHVAAILRGAWYSWEVVRPEVCGQERELQFGYSKLRRGKSGALYAKAQQMGYEPTQEELDRILERVRPITESNGYATEQDVECVIKEELS
jgi:isopropylmalate/homocitrate/citramalate synthase